MQLITALRPAVDLVFDAFAAHGMSGDFLRLTQIVSTNVHKINQNGKHMFILSSVNNSFFHMVSCHLSITILTSG